jgi:4-amino-4-deoxy-L-arabinose transferase-like glycosyltransferase
MLGGIALLPLAGSSPILRTQEARVLETARQMLGAGSGVRAWLFPTLNDEPRLKKPPLSYWMTAAAYAVGGVSETVGRIPTAILGWLTLGAVYVITARAFDERTALTASATLLASHLFFRHMRLAETDAPATLFITVAIGALWRGVDDPRVRWMHLAAASTALVILSKGAPAVFVAVFFIALCAVERRWDLMVRFARCGALLTLIAISVPWFIYIETVHGGGGVLAREVVGSVTGANHGHWPTTYAIGIVVAVAPWSAFLPIALCDACRRWRTDAAVRFILIWFAAVLIPLCINGNKQRHYLLMLMPPTMILVARLLVDSSPELVRWKRIALGCTVAAFAFGSFGIAAAGQLARKQILPLDWALSAAVAATVVLVIIVWKRRGMNAAIAGAIAVTVVLLPVLLGVWTASLTPSTAYNVAREIKQRFEGRPYVFYGKTSGLLLCFELRTEIPTAHNSEELKQLALPGTILIAATKQTATPVPVPEQFVHRLRVVGGEQIYDIYELGQP